MKNKNKVILLASIIVGVLVLTLGITYAVITFNETKGNSQLVLGDIWMKYEESNGISLEGVMPGSAYSNYFEFTITGTNTYEKKDIYYDISLNKGDLIEGKEETNRIEDKYLQFKLVEVVDNVETEIFVDQTYEDLTNKRIHVATIPKNTANYTKTYRLYMTLSSDLMIGNTNNAILTLEEFNNAFASIKVNVTGDFNEKSLIVSTSEECFNAYSIINDYQINTTDEGVTACSNYLNQQGFQVTGSYEEYCKGENANNSLKNDLDDYIFNERLKNFEIVDIKYFIENNIITNVEYGAAIVGYDETCGTDVVIPSTIAGYPVTNIYGYFRSDGEIGMTLVTLDKLTNNNSYNEIIDQSEDCGVTYTDGSHAGAFLDTNLTSVVIPNSVTTIGDYAFYNNSSLTSVVISNSVTTIGDYAFSNNSLTSVVIPNSVTTIGSRAFYDNDLTSVVISNGVTTIGDDAFSSNNLTSVVIPNSVTTIGYSAFGYNNLTSVEIGSGIRYIADGAFKKWRGYSNENLESITINKSCSDIKSITGSETNTNIYYPWTHYTPVGSTVYGANGEVCDTF